MRSGFIVRHRFYALVGLLSLRQFPVHWERNENKHAISKAYRMGSIHRPNPAWLCLLRQPPPRLGHAIQLCTQQPKRSPLMPGASSELQLLTPAKRPLLARPCRFGVNSGKAQNDQMLSGLPPKADRRPGRFIQQSLTDVRLAPRRGTSADMRGSANGAKARNRCAIARCAGDLTASAVIRGESFRH